MQIETLGTALIKKLEQYEVKFVFGIPGVHTVELYRGLSNAKIRHITPRHEQSAGFMADGYARITGKPGVCLVISGPGVTNILTAMAQARSDSIPMLVISGVNNEYDLVRKKAPLHSLPDQSALVRQIALDSFTISDTSDLTPTIDSAFDRMNRARPGPVHIQIPIQLMAKPFNCDIQNFSTEKISNSYDTLPSNEIQMYLNESSKPTIIIGGGARNAKDIIPKVAESLSAPVISTTNARDILGYHRLHLPASPSLKNVREIISDSDLVIAIGTEMSSTDFDFFEDNLFPQINRLLRVDIDSAQLTSLSKNTLNIECDSKVFCKKFLELIPPRTSSRGRKIIESTERLIKQEMREDYANFISVIDCITEIMPNAIIVGDSTQITYAGNFYCQITRDNRWFNSATGFGTLGYAPAASIGAKLAASHQPVICIVGDGGIQFCLSELGTAIDEGLAVIFLIWNNKEYREIRTFMEEKRIKPIGTDPTPPNFELLAESFNVKYQKADSHKELKDELRKSRSISKPIVIEIFEDAYRY